MLEEWITPALFSSFPKSAEDEFHDGCRFQLQSSFGKWVCAEDGGSSEVVADRAQPGDHETFTVNIYSGGLVCDISSAVLHVAHALSFQMLIRTWNGAYLSGKNKELSADVDRPDLTDSFKIHFADNGKVHLQASNGTWVKATPSGVLSLVTLEDPGFAQ